MSDHPSAWMPEPGDFLEGVYLRDSLVQTHDKLIPVFVVRTDDGVEVSVWCFWGTLSKGFDRVAPLVEGERIRIERGEDKIGKKSGFQYRDYKVRCNRKKKKGQPAMQVRPAGNPSTSSAPPSPKGEWDAFASKNRSN